MTIIINIKKDDLNSVTVGSSSAIVVDINYHPVFELFNSKLSIDELPQKGPQKTALVYGVEADHVGLFKNVFQVEAFHCSVLERKYKEYSIKSKIHADYDEGFYKKLTVEELKKALPIDNNIKLAAVRAGMYVESAKDFTNLCQVVAAAHLGNEKNSLAQDILKISNPCQVEAIASGDYLPGDVLDMKCDSLCPTIEMSGQDHVLVLPN